MSDQACALSLLELEAITESLAAQRDSIVRIMSQADDAEQRGPAVVDWDIIMDELRHLSAAIVCMQDRIDHGTYTARKERANDG